MTSTNDKYKFDCQKKKHPLLLFFSYGFRIFDLTQTYIYIYYKWIIHNLGVKKNKNVTINEIKDLLN